MGLLIQISRRSLAAVVAVSAVALWTWSAAAETTLERIEREGVIRAGFANEAPFGYAGTDGRLTGEAPEVARVIFGKIGDIRMEGVLSEFSALIPSLLAGRIDMIAAGLFIRPSRCEQVLFSNPSVGLGQAFLVKAGNPKGLRSYKDVAEHANAKLGVVAGGVERDYARKAGIQDDRVVTLPDYPTATAAVQTGRVDAMALSSLSIQNIIDTAKDPSIERAKPFTDPIIDGKSVRGYGGFAFRKEDANLRDLFDKHMASFIGTQAHIDLVKPFGFTTDEQPGDVTAKQLCAGG